MSAHDGKGEVCVDGQGADLCVDQRDTDPIVAVELANVLSKDVELRMNARDQGIGHGVFLRVTFHDSLRPLNRKKPLDRITLKIRIMQVFVKTIYAI